MGWTTLRRLRPALRLASGARWQGPPAEGKPAHEARARPLAGGSRESEPPWRRAMSVEMDRPRPVPWPRGLVVKNGSKMRVSEPGGHAGAVVGDGHGRHLAARPRSRTVMAGARSVGARRARRVLQRLEGVDERFMKTWFISPAAAHHRRQLAEAAHELDAAGAQPRGRAASASPRCRRGGRRARPRRRRGRSSGGSARSSRCDRRRAGSPWRCR